MDLEPLSILVQYIRFLKYIYAKYMGGAIFKLPISYLTMKNCAKQFIK